MSEPYKDIDEYAVLLGVPRSWVRDKVTAREIQFRKVGRHVRFTEADIAANEDAWLQPVSTTPSLRLVRGRAAERSSRRRSA